MNIPYMFYADKNQSEVQGILFHIAAQTLEDLASIFNHFLEDSTGNTQVFLGSCPLFAAQDDLSVVGAATVPLLLLRTVKARKSASPEQFEIFPTPHSVS